MANDSFASKGRIGLQSFKIPPERFISAPIEAILQDLQGTLRSLTLTRVYKREVGDGRRRSCGPECVLFVLQRPLLLKAMDRARPRARPSTKLPVSLRAPLNSTSWTQDGTTATED